MVDCRPLPSGSEATGVFAESYILTAINYSICASVHSTDRFFKIKSEIAIAKCIILQFRFKKATFPVIK